MSVQGQAPRVRSRSIIHYNFCQIIDSNLSLFLSVIGYGYLAPRSGAGRIFCVLYAAMGIPLTLLTLMSVGERFRQLIGQLVTFISRKVTNRRPRQKAVQVRTHSPGEGQGVLNRNFG